MLHRAAVHGKGMHARNASPFSICAASGVLASQFPPKGCRWSVEDRRVTGDWRAREEPPTWPGRPLTLEGAQTPVSAE